jgi:putative hydroxymethylpyrimidine transport system substrate-binding protein
MRRVVALLATVACLGFAACGDDGAEPGASREATLVLDFQPNAVHSGIYAALADGLYAEHGIELQVQEPSSSTDAPKLLAAGRTEFAILDIHDLGLARERGLEIVGVASIVSRPLAAVIARDADAVSEPADLAGGKVGVTGLPSDDAVLAAVLEAGGLGPAEVEPVTIGFDSVAGLSGGQLDAATAFWNAEGVILRRLGMRTREFRVDEFGAPSYPELVVVTSERTAADEPELVDEFVAATAEGYRAVAADPVAGLEALLAEVPALDPAEQRAQLDALLEAEAIGGDLSLDRATLEAWGRWDVEHGILEQRPQTSEAFDLTVGRR